MSEGDIAPVIISFGALCLVLFIIALGAGAFGSK